MTPSEHLQAAKEAEHTYKAEVAWTFPCVGASIIDIKGTCMEDAIDKFYKKGNGEILQIIDPNP